MVKAIKKTASRKKVAVKEAGLKNRICTNVNTIENVTLESVAKSLKCCDVDKCQIVKLMNLMTMYNGMSAQDKNSVINRICSNVNSISEAAAAIDPDNMPSYIESILIKYNISICDLFRIYQEWEIMKKIDNMTHDERLKLDSMAASLGFQ